MRVAINAWFWNSPTTGSGQYLRHLVPWLSEIMPDQEIRPDPEIAPDPEIVLIAPRRREPRADEVDHGPQSGVLNLPGIRSHSIADFRPLPHNLGKVWFEQIAFPRACDELAVDVAHVPYWAPPFHPTVPTVVTIHDLIPLLLPEYRGRASVRLYTALVSRTAHRADLVLTDSEAARRDIVTHLGLPGEDVRAIHLAADERFSAEPTGEDAAVRERYGLPERYVLYLGGFDVRKDVETLLRAWQQAGPAISTRYPLVIAGRLPERDTVFAPDPRRQARELRLETATVHFTGFIDEADKGALYRSALAFVFPSRYEGFGLPPLEALACGTPVICCRSTSLPEVVGESGFLVEPGDADAAASAVAQTLIELATNTELRANMARRAVEQAARFSWRQTAEQTLAAYRDVLAGAVTG